MKAKTYKTKPCLPVQAIQFTGDNVKEIEDFCNTHILACQSDSKPILVVPVGAWDSEDGQRLAVVRIWDWVTKSEHHVMRVSTDFEFRMRYEEA